jgi:hypothetical protein
MQKFLICGAFENLCYHNLMGTNPFPWVGKIRNLQEMFIQLPVYPSKQTTRIPHKILAHQHQILVLNLTQKSKHKHLNTMN